MKRAEIKQLSYFPKGLDKAVNDFFGKEVECETVLDFFGSMGYKTFFKAEDQKKEKIEMYIAGYIAGNNELADRLSNKKKFL